MLLLYSLKAPFIVNLTKNIQNKIKKPRIKNLVRRLKIKGHDEAYEKSMLKKFVTKDLMGKKSN